MKYQKPDMVDVDKPLSQGDAIVLYTVGDNLILYTYHVGCLVFHFFFLFLNLSLKQIICHILYFITNL